MELFSLFYCLKIISYKDWCFDPAVDHHQGDGKSVLNPFHKIPTTKLPVLSFRERIATCAGGVVFIFVGSNS